MHICADEVMAVMAALPALNIFIKRLRKFWHQRQCRKEKV